MRKSSRRRRNPFEHQQVSDAIRLVQIISENAKKVTGSNRRNPWEPEWDQSVLSEYEEPGEDPIYTPLNIVSASLTPRVSRKLLEALMRDADRPTEESYRGLFATMEEDTGDTYSLGEPLPASWVEEKRRGKNTFVPLERYAEDFDLDYDELATTFDIPREPKSRRLRKRRARRVRRGY